MKEASQGATGPAERAYPRAIRSEINFDRLQATHSKWYEERWVRFNDIALADLRILHVQKKIFYHL